MSNKSFYSFMALASSLLGSNGYSFDDIYYLSNEKIFGLSVKIVCEIRDLQEEGYSYEEVLDLIRNMDLSGEKLSVDETNFIKCDAEKSLKRIYIREEK